MGVLSDLFHRIFPASHPANGTDPALARSTAPPGSAAPVASDATHPPIDIGAVLMEMQGRNPQHLNWKTSIVDLMKLVGIDSSLQNRIRLANELRYTGDTNDSAAMNVWLHRQVVQRMKDNGGTLPAGLGE